MRAREILQEDYAQDLQTDLTNLLIGAKGAGMSDVSTSNIVRQLDAMGYSVDVNSILALLQDNPAITGATADSITFASINNEVNPPAGNTQDNASRVSDMASKATHIG